MSNQSEAEGRWRQAHAELDAAWAAYDEEPGDQVRRCEIEYRSALLIRRIDELRAAGRG